MNNSKVIWKGINEIISSFKKNKQQNNISHLIGRNLDKISNPKAISNTLNKHFSTVGQRLASRFSTSTTEHDFRDYLDPPLQNSFYFDPSVPQDIESEIEALPNNKAYGLYSCPAVNIVKLAGHIISQHLCSMFNLSVLSGSFPSKLKIAKVIPIFKGADESNPENYRPVSLLSIFNRIFE